MDGEEHTYPVTYEGRSDPVLMGVLEYFYTKDKHEAAADMREVRFSPFTFAMASIVGQFRVTSQMPNYIPGIVQEIDAHREHLNLSSRGYYKAHKIVNQ